MLHVSAAAAVAVAVDTVYRLYSQCKNTCSIYAEYDDCKSYFKAAFSAGNSILSRSKIEYICFFDDI